MNQLSRERRQGRRVRLHTPVRILQQGQPRTGLMRDLSEAGMFINIDAPCAVNAELVCDVCLPAPHQTLPVRGRVLWVQKEPEPGMGIEFLDLSEPDRSLLQRAVLGAPDTREVKVWLETLTHPIRARVSPAEGGALLCAPLPFLRLLSSVVVYPVDGNQQDSFSGTLDAVSLRPGEGAVPELQLHLSFPPAPTLAEAPTVVARPHRVAGRVATPVSAADGNTAAGELTTDDPKTTAPRGPGPRGDSADQLLPLKEEPYSLEVTPPTRTGWSLPESDPCARSDWTLSTGDVAALPQPVAARWRVWLWLATLAMVGVTAASMVYTKSWTRAWSWARAQLAAPPSPPSARPTIVPLADPAPTATAPAPVALPPPDEEPTPAVKQGPLVAAPFVGAPPARLEPHLGQSPSGEPMLEVPIEGSTKDAVHYRLAHPDGLVINLPNARPRAHFGDYRLAHGSFRLVWLRRRDSGLHVRVLFKGKLPAYRLKLQRDVVQVILEDEGATSPDRGIPAPARPGVTDANESE